MVWWPWPSTRDEEKTTADAAVAGARSPPLEAHNQTDAGVSAAGPQQAEARACLSEVGDTSAKQLVANTKRKRTVCVFVDQSPQSETAWRWAASNVINKDSDKIHLVTVSTPPLDTLGAVRADDDWPDSLGAAISSAEYYSPEKQARRTEAYDRALNRLVEVAAGDGSIDPGSVEKHLVTTELATMAGPAAVEFAKDVDADLAVLGSRGMGSLRRGLAAMVGGGSVSSYAVHNMPCPTVVVREKEGKHLPAGDSSIISGIGDDVLESEGRRKEVARRSSSDIKGDFGF